MTIRSAIFARKQKTINPAKFFNIETYHAAY